MRKSDVPAVCAMMRSLAASYGDAPRGMARSLRTYCFGKNRKSLVFLALIGKKPVGYAVTHDRINMYWGMKFRHVDFVFTEENYRRQGVGSALIQSIARDAVKSGCQNLSLTTAQDNNLAKKFYEKMRFKRLPLMERYRLEGSVFMRFGTKA